MEQQSYNHQRNGNRNYTVARVN